MSRFSCGISTQFEDLGTKKTLTATFISLNNVQLKVTQHDGTGYKDSNIYDIEISDQGGTMFNARWHEVKGRQTLESGQIHNWTQNTLNIQFQGFTELDTFTALFFSLGEILQMMNEDRTLESVAATIQSYGVES